MVTWECVSGMYLYGGRCEANCPPKTYPGINAKERAACMPCHYTCLTCAGESEGQCTSCHDESTPVPSGMKETEVGDRLSKVETMDESIKVEDLPPDNVHLSWGKREFLSLVRRLVLSKKAVTKKILEPYNAPRVLFYCYPPRVMALMNSSQWYRRMSILFALNLVFIICVICLLIYSRHVLRKKALEPQSEGRFIYTKIKNGDSGKNIENILHIPSSSEDEE